MVDVENHARTHFPKVLWMSIRYNWRKCGSFQEALDCDEESNGLHKQPNLLCKIRAVENLQHKLFVPWKPSSINYVMIAPSGRRARLYTFPLFSFPLTIWECSTFNVQNVQASLVWKADSRCFSWNHVASTRAWSFLHELMCTLGFVHELNRTLVLARFCFWYSCKKKLAKIWALSSHFGRRSMLPKAA